MIYSNSKHVSYEELERELIRQHDRADEWKEKYDKKQEELKKCRASKEKMKQGYEGKLAERNAIIAELEHQLAHMAAIVGRNGTNAGIPTSATPIGQRKVIPNSREKTGRPKGGQPGHVKHSMNVPDKVDETETMVHSMNTEWDRCSACGGPLLDTGEKVTKEEYDVRIRVVKTHHEFNIFQCADCGTRVHVPIGNNLKEANQYGPTMQGLALSLMVTGNVPVNKTEMLITGMTNESLRPSTGYISKLMRRAALTLDSFIVDLRSLLVQRSLIYWDETVIMIMTARACLRFYGDETIAFYVAHLHKDMDGLVEDNVLPALTSDTVVMHDHNKVNYNDRFCFNNVECNQHLQRDLQRVADDNPSNHGWAGEMKALISSAIHDRNTRIALGITSFTPAEIQTFYAGIDQLLERGRMENEAAIQASRLPRISDELKFERNLVSRIADYKGNYFAWMEDFSLPTTDNLSERSLRGAKTHLKVSGQFESEQTAQQYAVVKTYTETCRRNGINELEALSRLCAGNPYTVSEIFGADDTGAAHDSGQQKPVA